MSLMSLFLKQPSWSLFKYLFFTYKTNIQLLVLDCLLELYSTGIVDSVEYNDNYRRIYVNFTTGDRKRCGFVMGYGKRSDLRLSLLLNNSNISGSYKLREHRNYSAESDASNIINEVVKYSKNIITTNHD